MNQNAESGRYTIENYELPPGVFKELLELKPSHTIVAVSTIWATLIVLITAYRFVLPQVWQWALFVPFVFIIAGRQGAFLQLVHEASHQLLFHSRKWNDFVARWFCSLPLGVSYEGYVRTHLLHHAYTGTSDDPKSDSEKRRVSDVRKPELYLLFVKDLLGITAVSIFFAYIRGGDPENKKSGIGHKVCNIGSLCGVQLLILGGLFQFNIIGYILLWLYPAVGPHMFLMRIRGIAEHGLPIQMHYSVDRSDQGNFYTRSFLTPKNHYGFKPFNWLEKLLIGSLCVYYHHEHHLMFKVPYYNLRKLHEYVKDRVAEKNPEVYARGYMSAALRNILKHP